MITAPMEMIPTAGVSMIVGMILKDTMTAAMDLIVIEIMDMMNSSTYLPLCSEGRWWFPIYFPYNV